MLYARVHMHLRKEQLTLISLKVKKKMEPLLSDNYNPCNVLSLVNKIGYSCPILLWSSSPHLVCSNCFGSIVFHTLFGFSQNFWMAVLTRLLLGLFNGLHGPAKAYVSEISNANHQALGVSIIGTSWGLGLILGPALGGYLSQPALKYPNIFTEGSLFAR
jgi:MFS family permease